MNEDELQRQLESLTAHVRALQAAVTFLVAAAIKTHTNEAIREKAERKITGDTLPLSGADYPSRDEHALALSSLRDLFAERAIHQLKGI